MHIFLEISARLRCAHRRQLVDGRLQKFGDVLLNLLADAGLLQCVQELLILNVSKSTAQRTFHDVVVDHGSPSSFGDWARKGPLTASWVPLVLFEAEQGGWTVTTVAGVSDGSHRPGDTDALFSANACSARDWRICGRSHRKRTYFMSGDAARRSS